MFVDLEKMARDIEGLPPEFRREASERLTEIIADHHDWQASGEPALDIWPIYKHVRDAEAKQTGSSVKFCRRLLEQNGWLPPGVTVNVQSVRK